MFLGRFFAGRKILRLGEALKFEVIFQILIKIIKTIKNYWKNFEKAYFSLII